LELFNNNTNFINKHFLLKYSCYFLYYTIFVACLSMNLFFGVEKMLQVSDGKFEKSVAKNRIR